MSPYSDAVGTNLAIREGLKTVFFAAVIFLCGSGVLYWVDKL